MRGCAACLVRKGMTEPYYQMVGNCISLVNIPIGTWVHNICHKVDNFIISEFATSFSISMSSSVDNKATFTTA
jgi:hypothetical protein